MLSYQIFTLIVLKVNNVLTVLLFHSILLVHRSNFQAGNKEKICVKIRSRKAKWIHILCEMFVTSQLTILLYRCFLKVWPLALKMFLVLMCSRDIWSCNWNSFNLMHWDLMSSKKSSAAYIIAYWPWYMIRLHWILFNNCWRTPWEPQTWPLSSPVLWNVNLIFSDRLR